MGGQGFILWVTQSLPPDHQMPSSELLHSPVVTLTVLHGKKGSMCTPTAAPVPLGAAPPPPPHAPTSKQRELVSRYGWGWDG